MKRASKKLINAIIALVVSVILCIGVCLAWFSMNSDVSGNGLQTQVKSSDVVSFEVTASYLDFYDDSDKTSYKTASDGNVSTMDKTFDKDSNGTFNISSDNGSTSNDEMRSFDSTKMYSSAVLFTVNYEILAGCEKSFRIYATCPYTTEHMTENVFTVIKSSTEDDTYYSSVSNSVFLTEASLSGSEYTVKSSSETEAYNVKFIKEDYTKNFTKFLKTDIKSTSSDANTKGTLYYLMDYDEDLFNALTNAMLTSGGTLNSKIILDGDVIFGIEEYDTSAAEPTVETVTFVNSTSVTTQAAGSDVMTSSWQFLLDYSDDTLETVKYDNSESSDFVITGLDTSVVGESKTVTVTYKGITVQYQPAEGAATTSIPYTIVAATSVTGITLNRYTMSLIYDSESETPATAQLTATIAPSNATNQTVIWESSNTSVAMVSSTGLVTATGAGTAIITAKSDANNEITNSCTVTVTASSSATAVTGVTLDSKTLALYVNSSIADADKATLTATITPEGATNKDVTWTSSDPTVATVDTSGNVTALSVGSTNITVTTSDGGFTAVCSVMVYDASTMVSVTGVSIDKTTLSLTVGDSDKLTASITPSNATITSVSWSSSDDTVATVSSTGVVTAKKAGTATITVTTANGGKTATCAVTVSGSSTVAVTGVTLNKTSTTITVGSSETLTATISPADATNKNVTWSTSDSGIATVENGVVTAVAAGEATITVTTEDGSYSATCAVTVTAAASTEYTVTFDMNGHGTQITSVKTVDGKISAPTEPTSKNWSFGGWFTNATCTGTEIDFSTYTFEANTTIYAKWTVQSGSGETVYYVSVVDSALSPSTSGVFEWGNTTALQPAAMRFNSNNDYLKITVPVTVGQQVEITLNCRDGSSDKDISFSINATNATPTSFGSGTLSSSYYDFTADTFTVTSDGNAVFTITRGGGGTLWITSATVVVIDAAATTSYTVTFSSSITATGMPESQSVESGGKVTAPTTEPTATGYTFDNWYKDSDCTTEFDFDTETITSDTTIYAKWSATSYTITYNLDGGTNNASNPSTYTIESDTITLQDPTKDGYTFNGWYTESTFENQVTTIATGSTEAKTFYAKWTINAITGVTITSATTGTVGGTITLTAEVSGTGSYDSTVTWSITSGNSYATLSDNTLTLNSAGSVTVKATAYGDDSKYDEATITITNVTSWALDFSDANKVTTTVSLSENDVICDVLTVVTVGTTKLHKDGYLSTQSSKLQFEVEADAKFSMLWNGTNTSRTYVIKNSSGETVGSGNMSLTVMEIELTKDTYTIEFTGGEHKITKISLTYSL